MTVCMSLLLETLKLAYSTTENTSSVLTLITDFERHIVLFTMFLKVVSIVVLTGLVFAGMHDNCETS